MQFPLKPLKNVYKEAYIFGLPSSLFAIFIGVGFVIGMVLLMAQSLVVAIIGAVLLGGTYGVLYVLVEKFGPHFFKKLMAYYTDQNFAVLVKKRTLKNIIKNESKI